MGKPEPKPFPRVTMSGVAVEWSTPQGRPVRPKPVIISSAMKRAPMSWAASAMAAVNSGGGMTLPAVPCIGSMTTAATGPAGCTFMALRATSAQARPQEGREEPSGQR